MTHSKLPAGGRANISSSPNMILKADRPLKIWVWTAKFVGRGTESDQAYIAFSRDTCSPATAIPLPDPAGGVPPVPFQLEIGEELWAVSESVSLLGLSIHKVVR